MDRYTHPWEATDTEGHAMQCPECERSIHFLERESWDAHVDAVCPALLAPGFRVRLHSGDDFNGRLGTYESFENGRTAEDKPVRMYRIVPDEDGDPFDFGVHEFDVVPT